MALVTTTLVPTLSRFLVDYMQFRIFSNKYPKGFLGDIKTTHVFHYPVKAKNLIFNSLFRSTFYIIN